jgi:hypothetical protein
MQQLIPNAKAQFIDQNGLPLASGTVGFYFPGTLNPKPTFQDAAGTITNTNPVLLDSRGQALIWGSGVYRQIVKDASGVTIWDQITEDPNAGLTGDMTNARWIAGASYTDPVGSTPGTFVPGTTTTFNLPVAPGSINNIWPFFDAGFQMDDQIASLTGTALVFASPVPNGIQQVEVKIGTTVAIGIPPTGSVTDATVATTAAINASKLSFLQNGAGAVRRTVLSKLQDIICVTDFGAVGDDVADDTVAVQNAINYAMTSGKRAVYFPTAKVAYKLTAPININLPVAVYGDGCVPTIANSTTVASTRGPGSWFHLAHTGKGFVVDSGDSIGINGVTFSGVGTVRDHPTPNGASAWSPTVSDWDFFFHNSTDCGLDDVVILNPFQGVIQTGDNGNGGRFNVRGLKGQPMKTGLFIETSLDTNIIENCHFWPMWSLASGVTDFTSNTCNAYQFARCDGANLLNLFSIFCSTGLFITSNAIGSVNKLHCTNLDFDNGSIGILIDNTVGIGNPGATAQFVNTTMQGKGDGTSNISGVLVQGTGCNLTFSNLDITNFRTSGLNVSGASNFLHVSGYRSGFTNTIGGNTAIFVGTGSSLFMDSRPEIDSNNGGAMYGGAGTFFLPKEGGVFIGTTDASGQISIITQTTGLPPTNAIVTDNGSGLPQFCPVVSYGAGLINLKVLNLSGSPVANSAVALSYIASWGN